MAKYRYNAIYKPLIRCSSCGKKAEFRSDLKGFVKDKSTKLGVRSMCLDCYNHKRKGNPPYVDEVMEMNLANGYPLEEFTDYDYA